MKLYENIDKIIKDNNFNGWDNLIHSSSRILKGLGIVRMYLLSNLDDIEEDEYLYIKETHLDSAGEIKIIWEGIVYSKEEIINMNNTTEMEEYFWDKVLKTFI